MRMRITRCTWKCHRIKVIINYVKRIEIALAYTHRHTQANARTTAHRWTASGAIRNAQKQIKLISTAHIRCRKFIESSLSAAAIIILVNVQNDAHENEQPNIYAVARDCNQMVSCVCITCLFLAAPFINKEVVFGKLRETKNCTS